MMNKILRETFPKQTCLSGIFLLQKRRLPMQAPCRLTLIYVLYRFPDHQMLLKRISHLARIAEPRQIRANRAAYQDVLLYRHDQLIPVKYLLQDVLEYRRLLA